MRDFHPVHLINFEFGLKSPRQAKLSFHEKLVHPIFSK